ncbi:YceI family protein [Stappia sp. F7233]|uniref:YceI family protein n=1 Tax=Stappia albiluteola TaxID=2758565 RepID=A0A839A8C8_9HYPH|nr:YceI family protein [Stappia albiluteola]MBA5775820.1 YceI family protein [Stappia albiluteola]
MSFAVLRLAAPLAFVLAAFPAMAGAPVWKVDRASSELAFTAVQAGAPVEGRFEDWTAEISFDPAAPETARIRTTVNVASARTGQAQIDGTLPSDTWFDAPAFPEAVFEARGATVTGEGSYEAAGTLTIKGVSVPVSLPFALEIDGDTATAAGKLELSRDAWKIGAGIPEGTVATAVSVSFRITATR